MITYVYGDALEDGDKISRSDKIEAELSDTHVGLDLKTIATNLADQADIKNGQIILHCIVFSIVKKESRIILLEDEL